MNKHSQIKKKQKEKIGHVLKGLSRPFELIFFLGGRVMFFFSIFDLEFYLTGRR